MYMFETGKRNEDVSTRNNLSKKGAMEGDFLYTVDLLFFLLLEINSLSFHLQIPENTFFFFFK